MFRIVLTSQGIVFFKKKYLICYGAFLIEVYCIFGNFTVKSFFTQLFSSSKLAIKNIFKVESFPIYSSCYSRAFYYVIYYIATVAMDTYQ